MDADFVAKTGLEKMKRFFLDFTKVKPQELCNRQPAKTISRDDLTYAKAQIQPESDRAHCSRPADWNGVGCTEK